VTGGGVRSDNAGRSGRATRASGPRDAQALLFSSPSPMAMPVTVRGADSAQPAFRDDSLWAAFAPVLSDWTIQYGSSSLALNFCPSNVNSDVRFSIAFPCVVPCEVFHETLLPLLIAMV
jgi:hypothetical protein